MSRPRCFYSSNFFSTRAEMNCRSAGDISMKRTPIPLYVVLPSMWMLPHQAFLPVTDIDRSLEGLMITWNFSPRSGGSKYSTNTPPSLMSLVSPSMKPRGVCTTTGQVTRILRWRRLSLAILVPLSNSAPKAGTKRPRQNSYAPTRQKEKYEPTNVVKKLNLS